MADLVQFRLVILVKEPADTVPGQVSTSSFMAMFTHPRKVAVALPRVGERIEAASIGENCARHFPVSPEVTAVEHRLAEGTTRTPRAYVLVELELPFLDDAVRDDFSADGFHLRTRYSEGELPTIGH